MRLWRYNGTWHSIHIDRRRTNSPGLEEWHNYHRYSTTYDPVRMGAMTDDAGADATAFPPKRGDMVVNAEALAERRAAAIKNFILNILYFII